MVEKAWSKLNWAFQKTMGTMNFYICGVYYVVIKGYLQIYRLLREIDQLAHGWLFIYLSIHFLSTARYNRNFLADDPIIRITYEVFKPVIKPWTTRSTTEHGNYLNNKSNI